MIICYHDIRIMLAKWNVLKSKCLVRSFIAQEKAGVHLWLIKVTES